MELTFNFNELGDFILVFVILSLVSWVIAYMFWGWADMECQGEYTKFLTWVSKKGDFFIVPTTLALSFTGTLILFLFTLKDSIL